MRSVCGTCGSQGWKRLLVTCSKCRIGCEHRYCMKEHSLETSLDFVCADCSMGPVQNSNASESSKVVPQGHHRNKVRVESSNPVPRWKKIPETSRMKLISPEEVRKLSCGGNTPTFKIPRPVLPRSPMGLTKQTVCFPRASRSLNSTAVARKTNPILRSPKKVEHPSPRNLQNRLGFIRQASNAQVVGEGSKSRVGGGAKDLSSKEICRSILSEKLLQLLPYRPALRTIWKGRIVDSATPSVFSGEFLAQPASQISEKAYKRSKMIPVVLKGELVPIGNLLNDLFVNRNAALTDVEMYIFPNDKNIKRFKEEHAHLFEIMKARNAMIRINFKETPLLIFSSKQLDKSSQNIIQMQKKMNNFLWGIFLQTKKALAGTSNQTTKRRVRYANHRNPGKQLQRRYRERD